MPKHRHLREPDAHAVFLATWDWPRFVAAWSAAVGPLPKPLATSVPLAAPHLPCLDAPLVFYAWWPADDVALKQSQLQQGLLRFSNNVALDNELVIQRTGPRETAQYLADATSAEQRAALLIAAALHAYLNSRVAYLPEPLGDTLRTIQRWAWDAAGFDYSPWHHLSTNVLPGERRFLPGGTLHPDVAARLTGDDIVQALGSYHRTLLLSWRLVKLVVDAKGDPVVVAASWEHLAQQAAKQQAENDAWEARLAAEQEAEARQQEEHLRLHPRAAEWPPTADVLTELVWSMPTVEVANLFGVSDVAVAKRCDRLGVPKPPRGFWRKVEAGTIKHPLGQPPKPPRQRGS
jgi:hypothetical protein